MKAVTRSEHKRKELIICVLQHMRNFEDLGGIVKLLNQKRSAKRIAKHLLCYYSA